ncbi:MAG: stage III sporulation protein AF [Christensenellales bacterium]
MNAFTIWLLSVVGIVILGVLIDVILPEGSINKYIKAVFAFVVILVIISPLTKLNSVDVSLENLLNQSEMQLDEDYIFSLNKKILDQLNTNIIRDASKYGLNNVEVEFVSEIDSFQLKINEVNIFLYNLVIDKNYEHIDKYQILYDIVKTYIKIDKEKINFYE